MEEKHKQIPPEFIALAEKYALGAGGGIGFGRRVKVSELTGLSTDKLRLWIRQGVCATGTGFNFTKIRVLLRVLGYLPAPANTLECLQQAVVLGIANKENLERALGITNPSSELVIRAIGGRRDFSDGNLAKIKPFLTEVAAKVAAAEDEWRQQLLSVGFELGPGVKFEPVKASPVAAEAVTGESVRPMTVDASSDVLVDVIAPMLEGLYPLLAALTAQGKPEHFKKLRDETSSGTSNLVFDVKQLLGPMCSARAREISSHQS